MHPEIRGYIRERAREFLARQLIERGPYVQAAERGFISFDDIYFVGVCTGVTSVVHDRIFQRHQIKDFGSPEFQVLYGLLQSEMVLETSKLVAEIYNSDADEMQKKYRDIDERRQSWLRYLRTDSNFKEI